MSEQQVLPEPLADGGGVPPALRSSIRFIDEYVVKCAAHTEAVSDCLICNWKYVKSQLASALASLAQSEAERERLQGELDFVEQLSKSKLPCGHLSCYGFTDDGGKTGYCTRCELARERELNQGLRQVVIGMRSVIDGAGDIGFFDTDRAASLVIKADLLLEDKAKPVATTIGEGEIA